MHGPEIGGSTRVRFDAELPAPTEGASVAIKPASGALQCCYVAKVTGQDKKTGMLADTVSVRELFCKQLRGSSVNGPSTVSAPLFQRRYCWDKGLWHTLWEDIMACTVQEEAALCHSLGRVLLSHDDTRPGHFLCIDGQQRVTTVSLLLAVLLERLEELLAAIEHHRTASRMTVLAKRELLVDVLLHSREEDIGSVDNAHTRFMPTHFDRNAYVAAIYKACFGAGSFSTIEFNSHGDMAEESPVALCTSFFQERVRGLASSDAVMSTIDKVLDGLSIVVLTSSQAEGSKRYESFWRTAVISKKFWGLAAFRDGQGMCVVDLIRNLVLGSLSAASQARIYEQQWLPLETLIVKKLCGSLRVLRNGAHSAVILNKWFTEFVEDSPWIKDEEAREQFTMVDGLDVDTRTFPLFAIGFQARLAQLQEQFGGDKGDAVVRIIAELAQHASQQ